MYFRQARFNSHLDDVRTRSVKSSAQKNDSKSFDSLYEWNSNTPNSSELSSFFFSSCSAEITIAADRISQGWKNMRPSHHIYMPFLKLVAELIAANRGKFKNLNAYVFTQGIRTEMFTMHDQTNEENNNEFSNHMNHELRWWRNICYCDDARSEEGRANNYAFRVARFRTIGIPSKFECLCCFFSGRRAKYPLKFVQHNLLIEYLHTRNSQWK